MNPISLMSYSGVYPQSGEKSVRAIINLRLRISRNIARYPFPPALIHRPDLAREIWESVSDFLSKDEVFRQQGGDGCHKFYLPELKKRERIFLVERRLISPDMIKSAIPSGVVFSKNEKYIALINEEDHLRISVNDTKCPMNENSVKALREIVTRMDEHFRFAKNDVYGYLTSCPSNLGRGLRLSALFHLGGLALLRKVDEMLDSVEKSGYYVRGYYGEKSRYFGDVFQISTIQSPDGEAGLRKVFDFFLKIEESELRSRENLLKEKRIEDIIWRSWGALTSARLMSFMEAASALSIVMIGKDIGIEFPVKKDTISRLLVECQPAHIEMMAATEKPMSARERDAYRADYIRKTIASDNGNKHDRKL